MQKRVLFAKFTAVSIMILCMAAGITAEAFGGGYPVHPDTAPQLKETENSSMNCWTPSDSDYVFSVAGKKFVLLDTDDEGNYFILAEDEYGKYAYSTAYDSNQTIETRTGTGDFVPGPAYDMVYDDWKFNTENPTSIGYWLNHDFWSDGNGSFHLPDVIKEHVIEADWAVEGYKPIISWTASNYGSDGSQRAQAFVDTINEPGYTVRGKISLLSYTEYKQYQNIIGWMYCSVGWDGFMLRTPDALITADNSTRLIYKFGSVQVRNRTSGADQSAPMLIVNNDTPSAANFYVRPAMWLDKDFFKTVAIDLESAGTIVKNEIAENTLADLSVIYSDEELELLGFDVQNAPKAENPSVAGTPAEGALLYARYDFVSPSGNAEADSGIEWYISDSADGEYTTLGVIGADLKTDESMAGKYIKYRIMPSDNTGADGKYFWSEPTAAIRHMDIPVVSNTGISGSNMTITVFNPSSADKTVKILKSVYNSDNELVSVNIESIAVGAGAETAQNIDISEKSVGNRVTVMVWIENSQPIFYRNV